MSQIIANVPVWVWPLFIVLIFLGLRASKDRSVPLFIMYLLPLMGLISINTLVGLPSQIIVWSVYVAGFCLGATMGFQMQGRWIISYLDRKLRVRGEWLTLTVMMIIFSASFVNGILSVVAPTIVDNVVFIAIFVGVLSAATGFFTGRAARVISYVRATG